MTITFNKYIHIIETEREKRFLSVRHTSEEEGNSKRILPLDPTKIDAVSEPLTESIAQQTDSHSKRHPAGFTAGGFRAFLRILAVDRIE